MVVSLFSGGNVDFNKVSPEIYRVLKNNGKIYIMVLSKLNSKSEFDKRNKSRYIPSNINLITYSKSNLRNCFKKFKIKKIYYLTNQKHTLVLEGKKIV